MANINMQDLFDYDIFFDPIELGLESESKEEPVCPYFLQGNCRYGSRCWYRHPQVMVPNDADCSICYQPIKANGRQFGLLMGCPHIFCLVCIRQWRGQLHVSKEISRACPVCRVHSHFILPSSEPIRHYQEKLQLSESYQKHLATIPCSKFNYGKGECPFGTSCFYDHRLKNGEKWLAPKPEFACDEDGVWQVVKKPKLSDLINL